MVHGVQISTDDCPSSRWYVVQVQPGREHIAMRHLAKQSFRTYCPMRSKPRRIGRHVVSALSPFFPGYVFVSLDLERQRWRSINGTIGVLRIVCFGSGGSPAALPRGFVEKLEELSGPGGQLAAREELSAGDTVRILGGPFADLCGTLEASSDAQRVIILLEILSKQTRVQIRRELLAAA